MNMTDKQVTISGWIAGIVLFTALFLARIFAPLDGNDLADIESYTYIVEEIDNNGGLIGRAVENEDETFYLTQEDVLYPVKVGDEFKVKLGNEEDDIKEVTFIKAGDVK